MNQTTVNWAQLSNEHRENKKAGDRAEWKFESGESGNSGESYDSGTSDDDGESGDSGDDDTLPVSYPHRKYMVCMV